MTTLYDLSDKDRKRFEKVGVDYDLSACLEYNQQPFDLLDIRRVLAVWEGEHDEEDWRWVIELWTPKQAKKVLAAVEFVDGRSISLSKRIGEEGRFVFLQGGCDYTGWDCQSWASSVFAKTALQAAKHALGDVPVSEENHPANAGFGHMLNLLSGEYGKNFSNVYTSLVDQIRSGKAKTWREQKDDELGTGDLPKIA